MISSCFWIEDCLLTIKRASWWGGIVGRGSLEEGHLEGLLRRDRHWYYNTR